MDSFFVFAESNEAQAVGLFTNSFDMLVHTIISRPEFIEAQGAYLSNPDENYTALRSRFVRLLSVNKDMRDRDPYDTTLSIYLLLIYRTDPNRCQDLLSTIETARFSNLWWVRYTARLLQKTAPKETTNYQTLDLSIASQPVRVVSHIQNRQNINNSFSSATVRR